MNEELKAYASELVADGALSGTIRTDELTALLSRLEQAEQQVARVNALIAKHEGFGMNYIFIENLQTVLDGERDA